VRCRRRRVHQSQVRAGRRCSLALSNRRMKARFRGSPRCPFEGWPWDPSLMRVPLVPLAVGPPSKACLCDRVLEAREIAEVLKLTDSLVTVTMNIVLHNCGK
jgi:hypothetical protein